MNQYIIESMNPSWLLKVTISESRRQVGPILDRFGFQNVSVDDILDHFGSKMQKSELRRQVDPILDHFASQNEWVDYILDHFSSLHFDPSWLHLAPKILPFGFFFAPGALLEAYLLRKR